MTHARSPGPLSAPRPRLALRRGRPLPLGATVEPGGVNFAVASRFATKVTLLVFPAGGAGPPLELPLDPPRHTTGEVWHAFLEGADADVEYAYRMERADGSDAHLHRFDPAGALLDPYARALSLAHPWGPAPPGERRRRCRLASDDFDWGDDECFRVPYTEAVIYELHVRGFTRHASSGVSQPGTFAGLVEKIPYLLELGVNVVELLPVWEFEEADLERVDPLSGARLLDFWGYSPISFFAPKASYASRPADGGAVREFKQMVKSLHAAGIAVVLDVVLNHTGEGGAGGPTWSFRGIDNAIYYLLDPVTGAYRDDTGCGNTLNSNHPRVRDLIIDALRYWVAEMHVDGFRFDLASVLYRGEDGSVLANPPVIERISEDPILRHTALIAEAWDAAGVYQVGRFGQLGRGGRWAEWNGRFRDDLRRFVKGDPGMVSALATRLVGSPDLYETSGRRPYHSVNFVTSHDGFTLADLVSYDAKHNDANAEDNRDGTDANWSWNCGAEGPTDAQDVLHLRARQMRNFATLLFVSAGSPMILAGDEIGRTQHGNNNAWCQDNDVSWLDWRLRRANADLFRFFKLLIAFRRAQPLLRRVEFEPDGGDHPLRIHWHGSELGRPDWSWESRSLAMHLEPGRRVDADHVYVIANAHWEPHDFALPRLADARWHRFVDTSEPPPRDIAEPGAEEALEDRERYAVGPRSVVVLVGKRNG